MRPVLILQLVVYHAFMIYWGGWEPPVGFMEIGLYRHIAEWTYAFMLESFTFMSGYVFFYSCNKRGAGSFWSLMTKKARRLLLPMILFGIIYFFLFMEYSSLIGFVYDVLNGTGHLWYLVMLFWCFLEAWFLMQIKIDNRIKLIGIVFLAIFGSCIPLPFRISKSFYYLFFFFLPVLVVGKREVILERLKSAPFRSLVLWWGLFFLSFVLINYMAHYPRSVESLPLLTKAYMLPLNHSMQMIYSSLGVIAFYYTAMLIAGIVSPVGKDSMLVKIGNYCFGVYIFQQFVLKGLYFKTDIPGIVGPYILPWLGFVIALVVSFLLIYFIRLSKVGRALL